MYSMQLGMYSMQLVVTYDLQTHCTNRDSKFKDLTSGSL